MSFHSYNGEFYKPQKPCDNTREFSNYWLSAPAPCFTDMDSISLTTACQHNTFSSSHPSIDATHSSCCSSELLNTAGDTSGQQTVTGELKIVNNTTPQENQIIMNQRYTTSHIRSVENNIPDVTPCLFSTQLGYSSGQISLRIAMLQLKFLNVNRLNKKKTTELYNMYETQAGNLERERLYKLSEKQNILGVQYEINKQYDRYHEKLISRVERSLLLIENHSTKQMSNQVNIRKKSFSQFIPSVSSSCSSLSSLCQTPQKTQHQVFKFGNEPNNVEQRRIVKATSARNISALNSKAINIMKSWYECNIDYPYPSQEMCKALAIDGNISVSQVRKWFSNKRTRDNNTRSHEEISKIRYKRKKSTEEDLHCEKRLRLE